jgi:hypothetical protein
MPRITPDAWDVSLCKEKKQDGGFIVKKAVDQ